MNSLDYLASLPARLDDQQLATVEAMARSPLPALAACDDLHFAKCFRALQASLPKRASDELGGELMLAAYRRMLGHYPTQAIDFLCVEVLGKCEWFPSIAECRKMLEGWTRNDDALRAKRKAITLARNERQARLDFTMTVLERGGLDAEQIAALPEDYIRIASARALIWDDGEGKYRPRPLYTPEQLAEPVEGELSEVIGQLAEKFPTSRDAAA